MRLSENTMSAWISTTATGSLPTSLISGTPISPNRLDGPTHHGFDEFFGVPGNTEDPLDTEPRIYLRNDRWTFSDHSKMKRIGMKHREGRIPPLRIGTWPNSVPIFCRSNGLSEKQGKGQATFFLYYASLRITSKETQADLTPYPMPLPAPRSRGRANIPMGRRRISAKTWY